MKFDVVYTNAKVITVDPNHPQANWVGVKNGCIAAVGDQMTGGWDAEQVVDLAGKTMMPGFIDSHAHGSTTGFSLNSINLFGVPDVEAALKAVEETCKQSEEKDSWIFGTGMNVLTMKEGRPPTRWELDAVSGNHPVILVFVTFHAIACNTKAMEMICVPEDLPGVERDENGRVIGVYTDDESSFLGLSRALGYLDDEVIENYIRNCVAYANSKGVTTLHSLDGKLVENDRDIFIWLTIKDSLPINSVNWFQTTNVHMVKALGLPRIGGCLTLDGTGFERTMATSEPYGNDPECRGVLYWTDEEVYHFVSKAHKAGLQIAMHAIGDRAIDQLIKTYDRVIREQGNPKGLRHRVEHFGLCTPAHIQKAAELGLVLSMQPVHDFLWDNPHIPSGKTFESLIGRERTDRNDPFPEIIKAGGIIAGGSDSAVTPIDPLWGIHSAANAPNPKRKVPLDEAIKMFTINGAWAAHQEKERGSIEVGKIADLVVIDKNPYEDPENIMNFNVEMTIVGGRTVYVRPLQS